MPSPAEMNSDTGSNTQHGTFTTKSTNRTISSSSHQQQKSTHLRSDMIDSPMTTTNGEIRKGKHHVSNDDQASLNKTFRDILDTLARYDKFNIKRLSPFHTIQEKVDSNHYDAPDEFKSDIDQLFAKVRSDSKTQQQNDIEQLYVSVLASIQLEIDRGHPSLMMDTSTLHPNTQDQVRTALFRPTLDGFIFTDASANINQHQEHLPTKLQTIAVHPAPPESFTVPTLKQSIQQPFRFPARYSRHEDKPIIPIQWLDYGIFTTFAPVCDSNNANTSYESTYMGRAAKRHKRWERKQRRRLIQAGANRLRQQQQQQQQTEQQDGQSDMDYDIDIEWLKDQGLNVDAILDHVALKNTEKEYGNENDDATSLLVKNEKLIGNLLVHQENRFKTASAVSGFQTHAELVDEEEQETANKLQQNLYQMLSHLSPSSVIRQKDIELAMSRLPLQEAVYRGSLPSNKIFAYPTTETIDPSLPPPFANITPTYSKDRWRMIDVQGHDQPSSQPPPSSTLASSSPSASSSAPLMIASPSSSQKPHPTHTSSPLR